MLSIYTGPASQRSTIQTLEKGFLSGGGDQDVYPPSTIDVPQDLANALNDVHWKQMYGNVCLISAESTGCHLR